MGLQSKRIVAEMEERGDLKGTDQAFKDEMDRDIHESIMRIMDRFESEGAKGSTVDKS